MKLELMCRVICALLFLSMPSLAGVSVSSEQRFLFTSKNITLKSKQYFTEIVDLKQGEGVEIYVTVGNKVFNDLTIVVCPEVLIQPFLQGQQTNCYGIEKAKGEGSFAYNAPTTGKYAILLDNSYANFVKKEAHLTVFKHALWSMDDKGPAIEFIGTLYKALHEQFEISDYDISLEPCGMENASANTRTGNITLCSELYVKLMNQQRIGALLGIFLHEVGHSFLGRWGLPNHSNEETVDEFALYMLYLMGRQELGHDMARYFQELNSVEEAKKVLIAYNSHPISIQRYRKISEILQYPGEFIPRWNKFLYPLMTEAGLKAIEDNPGVHGDRQLAFQTRVKKFSVTSKLSQYQNQ